MKRIPQLRPPLPWIGATVPSSTLLWGSTRPILVFFLVLTSGREYHSQAGSTREHTKPKYLVLVQISGTNFRPLLQPRLPFPPPFLIW